MFGYPISKLLKVDSTLDNDILSCASINIIVFEDGSSESFDKLIDIGGFDLDFFIFYIKIDGGSGIFIFFKVLISFRELIFRLFRLHGFHLTEAILTIFR
jgi:hypothetical protein